MEFHDVVDREDTMLVLDRASLAPMGDEVLEMLALVHLEAGTLTAGDLAGAMRQGLPDLPEDLLKPSHAALIKALEAYKLCLNDPERARELTAGALELDPECIEAMVAEWMTHGRASDEALDLAARASAVSHVLRTELALEHGELSVDLWDYPRMRAMVRAEAALALTLWARGEREEAIAAAERTLRLSPCDALGISSYLLNWHLAGGQSGRAYRLLRDLPVRPEEFIAPEAFGKALLEFVRSGPGKKARRTLLDATRAFPMVAAFLFRSRKTNVEDEIPYVPLHIYEPRSVGDVLVWFTLIQETWTAVAGALEWAEKCGHEPQFQQETEGMLRLAREELRLFTEGESDSDGPLAPPPATQRRLI